MQTSFKHRIFNRVVQLILPNSLSKSQLGELLAPLSLYPDVSSDEQHEVEVEFVNSLNYMEILSSNPSNHSELKEGFVMHNSKYSVAVTSNGEILKFTVYLSPRRNIIVNYLSKLYSMDYATITQRLSQIFFEQVMVPSVYFNSDQLLIHSSSMVNSKNQAILIGGTGGVGKTSLEIELCMNRGYTFMSDDISIVDSNGFAYPNHAFPKIYAYNTIGKPSLRRLILKDRSFHDRIAWHLKWILFGPASVRRKISPEKIYGSYATERAKTMKYFILIKEDRDDLLIQRIDTATAASMSIKVIETEYSDFNKHILWHEFYCNSKDTEPIVSLGGVKERWMIKFLEVFSNVEIYALFIPSGMNHIEFIQKVSDIITE
jgi:hypothetical protein